jgi:hypothetical protein
MQLAEIDVSKSFIDKSLLMSPVKTSLSPQKTLSRKKSFSVPDIDEGNIFNQKILESPEIDNIMDVSLTARTKIVKEPAKDDQLFILKHVESLNSDADEELDIQTVRAKVSYCLTDRKMNKIKGSDLPIQSRKLSKFEEEIEELK